MRMMNGRLHMPLRNNVPNNQNRNRGRNRADSVDGLPKSVQFDESSDEYRCLCGIFHIKTGAYIISGIEIFLIFFNFLNSLLVLLQQKNSYDYERGDRTSDYVMIAFIITSIALGIAMTAVLLMLLGLARNCSGLLIPHLIVQLIAIICFLALVILGILAVVTDVSLFYRLLNAAPFNEYPGQNTVALPADIAVRIYAILIVYFLSLVLEFWFIVVIYYCYQYLNERKAYMRYCMAYSTPLKTLNSR